MTKLQQTLFTTETPELYSSRDKLRQAMLDSISPTVDSFPLDRQKSYSDTLWTLYNDLFMRDFGQHYLAMSLEYARKVSFASNGDRFNTKRRTALTLGRYLSRQYRIDEKIPPHYVERYVTAVNNILWPVDAEITYDADAIRQYYQDDHGEHSCMSGDDCDKIELWAHASNVGIAILNKPDARALIMHTDCGETVLDRIYPNNTMVSSMLRNWGLRQGYYVRESDSGQYTTCINSKGDERDDFELTIDISDDVPDAYPYADSFKYVTSFERCETITISTRSRGSVCILNSCSGVGPDCGGNLSCENCGDRMTEDESHSDEDGNSYCEHCWHELFTCCYQCNESILIEEANRDSDGDSWCDDCHTTHHSDCDCCCESTHNDNLVSVELIIGGETRLDEQRCESCLELDIAIT